MKICRKRQISSSYPAIHGRSLQGGLRRCIRRGWHLILCRSAFEGPSCDRECYKGPYAAEADFLTDVLMQAGVLREAILQEREATFTLENAEYIRKMLEEKHLPIKRAIICCQAFHARRCRMYFEYVFQDREIEFLMCPAVTQGISRDNWAESKKGLETVLGDAAANSFPGCCSR